MGAQLRDVLAAKDSAVMTKKDDNRRPVRPEEVELNRTFVRVRQNDPGETLGVGTGHAKRV